MPYPATGQRFACSRKLCRCCVCLAQHAGEPVSKEKLLGSVWTDTFVTDDVLTRAISECAESLKMTPMNLTSSRQFLSGAIDWSFRSEHVTEAQAYSANPAAGQHHDVSVVKGWLYSLSSALMALLLIVLVARTMRGGWARRAPASGSIHSIAVLPLQNLSSDPAQEYFSDGLTDALITDLAQMGSLKVISRTSSMQYKQTRKSLPEIARELNVDGIVEGTVQRWGDRVRITAQLVEGSADKHVWANSYERDIRDAFALERDVAEDIAASD